MSEKIIVTLYSIFLSIIAIGSIAISWVNDSKTILIFGISVDLCLIIGCFLSLYFRKIRWWALIILFAVFGEIYLLATSPDLDLITILFWVGVLLPALYLNLKVVGFLNRKV